MDEFKVYLEEKLLKKYREELGQKRMSDLRTYLRSFESEENLKTLFNQILPSQFKIKEDYEKLKKEYLDSKTKTEKPSMGFKEKWEAIKRGETKPRESPITEEEAKGLEAFKKHKTEADPNLIDNDDTYKDWTPVEFIIYDEKNKPTKVNIEKVVIELLDKGDYEFKTIFFTKGETIYLFDYETGYWTNNGKELIKTETERLLGSWCKNHVVQEIIEKIKRKTAIDADEFNKLQEGFICIENGIFDLNKQKLLKFTPDYYFKTKIPITFDPKKDCPKIKKFFKDMLYEEDVPVIQEWFGFNLYNRYFEKKAMIAFGDADTGKTVTLNLLIAFLGEKNKVNLSLQQITNGKSFDLLDLKDMYANIHDDLSDKDLATGAGFKISTGGGYITGEEKFGDRIDFKTFAKHLFATNKIPSVSDIDDDAYWMRWIPIPFDNQIKRKKQDKSILNELTTKEEMSGLFNWSLIGLKRLIKNNGFSFNKTVEEVKTIMQRNSHPLSAFSQDWLVKDKEKTVKITKEEMFEKYSCWCEMENKARMTKEQLGRQLGRFVSYIIANHDGKVRFWQNVKWSVKAKEDMVKLAMKVNEVVAK